MLTLRFICIICKTRWTDSESQSGVSCGVKRGRQAIAYTMYVCMYVHVCVCVAALMCTQKRDYENAVKNALDVKVNKQQMAHVTDSGASWGVMTRGKVYKKEEGEGGTRTVVAAVLACLKIPGNKCNKNYS